ncbi:thrombospondin type 3 repeat-containing protein [Sorangium cellulosum]|uniref:thrombospondin type 3 repeat-containing protein n=1 Tax=Sorangium cellulosum TaxID=56 RepID=UPI003D9A9A04
MFHPLGLLLGCALLPGAARVATAGITYPISHADCGANSFALYMNGALLCSATPDLDQTDGDGIGDAYQVCASAPSDRDGDGVCDAIDNCVVQMNPDQADGDGDGAGDACDACAGWGQYDNDGDGLCNEADGCDDDHDPDQRDSDGDGTGDACDGCPTTPDPAQKDRDYNGIGDA